MVFLSAKNERGRDIAINIDAIGYIVGDQKGTTIYITGGQGGEIHCEESYQTVLDRLIGAEAEII